METRLGQAAPLVVAMEAILATCPLVAEVEAVAEGPCEGPWLLVMPRRSLSLRASPGGLPVPVGCPVLSVWPWRAFLSCLVLFCVSSPGGLLIPPNFPKEIFFWGVEGFRLEWPGRGTRPRPWMTTCHGLLSSQLRHGLQSSQLRHGLRCLFRSGGPRPVFLSVFVLRGLQSAHPPSPVELLRRATHLPGGGSYVRVLLCVSCVPASCVHIWFVSCPCFMSLWVNLCPAVCMWLCVNYPVYISLLVTSRCILSLCLVLSCLVVIKTIIWVYVLVCVFLFLPRVCTVTHRERELGKLLVICYWFQITWHKKTVFSNEIDYITHFA